MTYRGNDTSVNEDSPTRGMLDNSQVMLVIEAIRTDPLYQYWYERLVACERERIWCKHQMRHLLDVARIAYILNLERGLGFRKEVIYAAALLHDIGKAAQYETGEPHEVAGARIAEGLLGDIESLTPEEKAAIVVAVREHRRYDEHSSELGKLLFMADKASRDCFACAVRDTCDWPDEKKNAGVKI